MSCASTSEDAELASPSSGFEAAASASAALASSLEAKQPVPERGREGRMRFLALDEVGSSEMLLWPKWRVPEEEDENFKKVAHYLAI